MRFRGGLGEALREVVERLKRRYEVHLVVLFGSRARGDWGPWSDVDLLVVAEDFESKPYLERLRELLDLAADIPEPLDFHPYTLSEALEMLRKLNPTIVDALWEGVVLYSDEASRVLFEELEKLKRRGLRRSATTIYLEEAPRR